MYIRRHHVSVLMFMALLATVLLTPVSALHAVTPQYFQAPVNLQPSIGSASQYFHQVRLKTPGGKKVVTTKTFARASLNRIGRVISGTASSAGKFFRSPAAPVHQVVRNAIDGRMREKLVVQQLRKQFPEATVQNQVYLRDVNGKRVVDKVSGTSRRLDHVVVQNGKVIKIVETTSPAANKFDQALKEESIKRAGGVYVRDRATGRLVDIRAIQTDTARVDLRKKTVEYER